MVALVSFITIGLFISEKLSLTQYVNIVDDNHDAGNDDIDNDVAAGKIFVAPAC